MVQHFRHHSYIGQLLFLAFVCLPIIIVAAIGIQSSYDRLVKILDFRTMTEAKSRP
jgi:hypothetical protein